MSDRRRAALERGELAELRDAIARLDAKLDTLIAEVRGLRPDHARERHRPSRANVLAAIAIGVGDRAFNASEVMNHAEVDRELAAVLEAARITSPRSLGRYLQRIADRPIHGVRVIRLGEDRDGIVWRASFEVP